MKQILLSTTIAIFFMSGCAAPEIDTLPNTGSIGDRNISKDSQTENKKNIIDQNESKATFESIRKFAFRSCDRNLSLVLEETDILTCYNDKYNLATADQYMLKAEYIDSVNIKQRPRFRVDDSLPEDHQIQYSDYTHTGFDRGHLANDASFDYNEEDLKEVYRMSNIVPQDPNVNRYMWSDAEERAREIAREYGKAQVINIVLFSENPQKIGKLTIPKAFWKVISYEDKMECYHYNNYVLGDFDLDRLEDHLFDCKTVIGK